jgi:transposase
MSDEHSDERSYEPRVSAHKSDVFLEMRRVRKRVWTTEEKLAILREGMAPGAVRADVMRRYGISSSLFYTWRKQELTVPPAGFAAVQIAGPAGKAPAAAPPAGSRIEIVTAAGTSVRIDGSVDALTLAAVLKALRV